MIASHEFDKVFADAVQGTAIPVEYLRALAQHESAMHPTAIGPGKERGLLQIHPVTLAAYNLANHANVSADSSAEPLTNARIAVWLISKIVASFGTNHPRTLKEDWRSRRWVGLVTQAYNVGESEENGVGKLVKRLELQNVEPDRITYQTVAQANLATRDNQYASDGKRLAYIGRVLDDYFAELGQGKGLPDLPAPAKKADGHYSLGSESWPCSLSAQPAKTLTHRLNAIAFCMRQLETALATVAADMPAE